MNRESVLIYGGGNCGIASSLQQELEKIGKEDGGIFARGYIFGSSCLAMYKRFEEIKDRIDTVKAEGVWEYLRTDTQQVKTMEMQMRDSSNREEIEDFLSKGFDRLEDTQITLVLIGQSNEKGMFLDFLNPKPTYMPYSQMLHSISKMCKSKNKRVRLILDMPKWHAVKLPFLISRYKYIDEVFIYEREDELSIIPISKYIKNLNEIWQEKENSEIKGYMIDVHPIWWNFCKWKWEEYLDEPCRANWKVFYSIYKNLVSYNGSQYGYYKTINKNQEILGADQYLSQNQLKAYFKEFCKEELDDKAIEEWLQEMKSCVDYYKL
ncbi:MAG: hypothetical protein RR324_04745 [Cellulosilyticaceae bacterium]